MAASLNWHACSSSSSGATLEWDAVTEDIDGNAEDIFEYRIVYGTTSGTYDQTISVGNVTSYAIPVDTLQPGTTYYFAVKAVDLAGNESDPSSEINYTTPGGSS